MKQSNKFLTRCLALLIALAICLGNINMGLALTVSAAGNSSDKTTVNVAESGAQNNEHQNVGTDTQSSVSVNGVATNGTTLYDLIAELSGNDAADAILTSGALANNTVISYQLPAAENVVLSGGILTAENQASLFEGLEWVALTYGATKATAGANNFDENHTTPWNEKSAYVVYGLQLDSLFEDEYAAAEAMLRTLKNEYDIQKEGMADLVEWKPDMEQLNRSELGLIYTMITDFDFTEEDGNPNDVENLKLRAYFQDLIAKIVNNCCGPVDLTIVDMLKTYEKNGMSYYYQNAATIYEEVTELSGYLQSLVGDEQKEVALAKLMNELGYDNYVELIDDLGSAMADIAEKLGYDNAGVKTTNLLALKAYVAAMDSVAADDIAVPYINTVAGDMWIIANPIKVTDESVYSVIIEVIDEEGNVSESVALEFNIEAGEILTEEHVAQAKAEVQKIVENTVALSEIPALDNETRAELESMGEEYVNLFWEVASFVDELDEMVGEPVYKNITPSVSVNPKKFYVYFNNASVWSRNVECAVTTVVDGFKIELPASSDPAYRYEYYMNDQLITEDTYQFTLDQMVNDFTDGAYTMERKVIDRRAEAIANLLAALNAELGEGAASEQDGVITIKLDTVRSLSPMAQGFLSAGYTVALNEQPFLYYETATSTVLSMQSLLDAVIADPVFTEQTIIDLAEGTSTRVMTANLTLGDGDGEITSDLKLELHLLTAPEQLTTIANGLKILENNFAYSSSSVTVDGEEKAAVAIDIDLPEKIYELYLAALVSAGELDQSNVNAINNKIATMFFYDYINAVMGSENISIDTFQNTLDIMINSVNWLPKVDIEDKDITDLAKYFDLMKQIYDNLDYTPVDETNRIDAYTTDVGLNRIMEILGIELNSTVASAVIELRPGHESYFHANATLVNANNDFEALVFDFDAAVEGAKDLYDAYKNSTKKAECIDLIKGQGIANAIDFEANLSERELNRQAIIMLMGDTQGDLVINHATILDLNGHTINGNVVANGHLLIVDSTLSNTNAGGVNGDVSGHVMIMSGNYTDDVTAFLKDGYVQDENGMVHNELFWIERNGQDLTYVLNSDVMHEQAVVGLLPNMAVVATEIAVDMALNQYADAALSINGLTIYETDLEDVIGLLASSNKLTDVAKEMLDYYDSRNIAKIAAGIAKELIDFEGIANSIDNDAKLGDALITVSPYYLQVKHVYGDGDDYLTFGFVNNPDVSKTVNVGFKFAGNNVKQLLALFREMNRIVDVERTYINIDLFKPTYEDQLASFGGSYDAQLSVDLTVGGTEDAYKTIIAVALAFGNEDNRAELVAALLSGDENALKAAVDKCSVEDVITAMKELERFTTFREMAASLGVTIEADDAKVENIWHFVTVCFGEMLDVCRINGCSSVLGNLDKDNDGRYVIDSNIDAEVDAYVKGYGAYVNVELVRHAFELKLFNPTTEEPVDCLWGDVNHDGEVDSIDATLVLQWAVELIEKTGDTSAIFEGEEITFCFAKADVSGDGEINSIDATLILQYAVGLIDCFPAEIAE